MEGLEKVLEGCERTGLAKLRHELERQWNGSGDWRLVGHEPLLPRGNRVSRLRFARDAEVRSLIAKRLEPAMARRSELIARRWLPSIGLDGACPLLLGSVAASDGSYIWHFYEDLGHWEWGNPDPESERVRSTIALIARIHTRFADHALLGEIRMHGPDYGIHFYETNVHDAICALKAVKPQPEHRQLCARLLERLAQLHEELPVRMQVLAEFGGPETLLHGDLWTINVFYSGNGVGFQPRLIDWDRTGVGPVSYDLSTFLLRFPESRRWRVFALYERAVARVGWQLPGRKVLNSLFETAELARYANRVIWPAIALAQDGADWGFPELEAIDQWFEELRPVLPPSAVEMAEPLQWAQ